VALEDVRIDVARDRHGRRLTVPDATRLVTAVEVAWADQHDTVLLT
jgi:hypothetical protein